MKEMNLDLPQITLVEGLRCEDHATFVAPYSERDNFIAYWASQGLVPLNKRFITTEFPAEHIALVRDPNSKGACEDMIGLSVSQDPTSPINRSISLHGGYHSRGGLIVPGKIQHVAYDVDPTRSMNDVCSELESKKVFFMTPIFSYTDTNGATLEQRFVASPRPFGPFVEIIRRGLGRTGEPFQGFNSEQIDNLYRHYNAHSESLLRAI